MTYCICLAISLICVLVIDQFHFVDEVTTIISGWISNGQIKRPMSIKPFSCSLCMTFWLSLIYIIVVNQFSVWMVLYILLLCYVTPIENQLFTLLKGLITKFLDWIGNIINI